MVGLCNGIPNPQHGIKQHKVHKEVLRECLGMRVNKDPSTTKAGRSCHPSQGASGHDSSWEEFASN